MHRCLTGSCASRLQLFIDHLVGAGRSYGTIAGYVKSYIAIARFVHAVKMARAAEPAAAVGVSNAPVVAMRRAYQQATQQARLEQKFASKPKAWLDWDAVQVARAKAVRLYEQEAAEAGGKAGGESGAQHRLRRRCFDAALLTWLTSVPPDRVGVARQLRIGVTLKPTADGSGFQLDLSTPDAHKTAAAFGPVVTSVPAPAAALLKAWLALTARDTPAALAKQLYVWVPSDDDTKAVAPSSWTELVKAAFKRHAGVPLAPKELRSSLVCWMRSESNSDAVLKSAAWAMRHSTQQQAGPAYDRERGARLSKAAVDAVGAHAARFA